MDARTKLYNIEKIVKILHKMPLTYKMILEEEYYNPTMQVIARRKMNALCRSGIIMKTNIPGTRFGETIFYAQPKDYTILIEGGRAGSTVYCFNSFEDAGMYYIKAPNYHVLEDGIWKKVGKAKVFFEGNTLKWV